MLENMLCNISVFLSYLLPQQTFKEHIFFLLLLSKGHDQKCPGSEEHIDLSVFKTQTGPDKVVIIVSGVYTIT